MSENNNKSKRDFQPGSSRTDHTTAGSRPSFDSEIDEELAKSIEKLVEEETNVARAFVGGRSEDNLNTPGPDGPEALGATRMFDREGIERKLAASKAPEDNDPEADFWDDPDEEDALFPEERDESQKKTEPASTKGKKPLSKKNKLIIAGVSALVAVVLIAIVITAAALNNRNKKSYDYNLNKGMEYYNARDYAQARDYLEKAHAAGKGKKNIDLMYALYECYAAEKQNQNAADILREILSYDQYHEKAITALAGYYSEQKEGEALTELIKKYKGTKCENLLTVYEVAPPVASETAGTYEDGLQLNLLAEDGCRIYYTTDEKDPTVKSTEFKDEINLSQGTVILKAIAVNEIGVCSEVAEYKYIIEYKHPDAPQITPESGSYEAGELVSIENLADGDKAFYTLDGTTPTANSIPYSGPFTLKEGNVVVSVVIISPHDISSTVTRNNYEVKASKTYTYSEAETLLKNRMIALNLLKNDGVSMTNGGTMSFVYQSKKTINDIEMYYIRCDVKRSGKTETQGYYGVGLKNGQCYKVTENSGQYSAVQY